MGSDTGACHRRPGAAAEVCSSRSRTPVAVGAHSRTVGTPSRPKEGPSVEAQAASA